MSAGEKRGKGTIDRLPSGRFRVRISSPKGQMTWGTFDTMEIAQRELGNAVVISSLDKREYEGLTVRELGERVVSRREVKREVRDWKSDRSRWDNHMKGDEMAAVGVAKVQPKHIYAWIGRLTERGLAAQTIRNCRNLLSVIMREAVRTGLIPKNPCAEVRIDGQRVSEQDGWTYLVPDEQVRLLRALSEESRWIVAFAIGTGLRAGELCALRRVDVDVEGHRLLVRYGKPPSRPTKTGKLRPAPLFGIALEAVKAWIALKAPPANGPLFPRSPADRKGRKSELYGAFRDPNHVLPWKEWQAAVKTAELGRRFRWHDLRHTCASSLVSGWWGRAWSIQEVKEMLGHTTIDITQRYAHLAPGALAEAARGTPGSDLDGPKVTSKSLPENTEPDEGCDGFLNRRSQVRLLSGALSVTPEETSKSESVEPGVSPADVTSVTGPVSEGLQAARAGLAAVYGGAVPS